MSKHPVLYQYTYRARLKITNFICLSICCEVSLVRYDAWKHKRISYQEDHIVNLSVYLSRFSHITMGLISPRDQTDSSNAEKLCDQT